MDPTDDKVKVREKAPRERDRLIRLGGSTLGTRAHICAFFNTPDDEYRVLLPFIYRCKDGAYRWLESGRPRQQRNLAWR